MKQAGGRISTFHYKGVKCYSLEIVIRREIPREKKQDLSLAVEHMWEAHRILSQRLRNRLEKRNI